MRAIWFFMNGDRGEATARAIVKAGHVIQSLVVPAPKRDRFASLAAEIGAEMHAPHSVNDEQFIRAVASTQPFLGVCAGFSTIFTRLLIHSFEFGVINLHAGKVPEYRGGSPLNWQIINGEKTAGLSVLAMTEGIDDGPVLASTEIQITDDDDIASMHAKANAAFPPLVIEAITKIDRYWGDCIKAGPDIPSPGTPQDEKRAIYRLQRNDTDGAIDWHRMTARQVFDLVRAVTTPYPGAHSNGTRILKTEIPTRVIKGPPGRIVYLQGDGPFVCCADRAIKICEWSGEKPKHGRYL